MQAQLAAMTEVAPLQVRAAPQQAPQITALGERRLVLPRIAVPQLALMLRLALLPRLALMLGSHLKPPAAVSAPQISPNICEWSHGRKPKRKAIMYELISPSLWPNSVLDYVSKLATDSTF